MTLYIEKLVRGEYSNLSFYAGIEAFYNMGFEFIEVDTFENLSIKENNIFFGSIQFVQSALNKLGVEIPEHNDYPGSLTQFYGRKISESTNEVLGVKSYKGDWRAQYDYKIIEEAVHAFENPPAGYAIDFGLTKDNKFLIVEVNEGYSIGNYGLFYIDYAKLIAARWAEMTNQKDLCRF